jgi:predicted phosphodiesterase
LRILVLSDVHGNLPALEAVLRAAGEVDAIWNLGDTVGYGARPNECVTRLQEVGSDPFLAGNHDLAAVGSISNTKFNPTAAVAIGWTTRELLPDHAAWLRSRVSMMVAEAVTVAHGSPRDPINEYVIDAWIAADNFGHFSTGSCLVGHTHVAAVAQWDHFARRVQFSAFRPNDVVTISEGRFIINPGSVGQPRDMDSRAAYAVLETSNGTIEARRTEYDIELAQRQIVDAGLPAGLAQRLQFGL